MMNFEVMCTLEALIGLACIMPMMNALDYHVKFFQDRACFVGDIVVAIEIFQANM